jgi:hypothetical protein
LNGPSEFNHGARSSFSVVRDPQLHVGHHSHQFLFVYFGLRWRGAEKTIRATVHHVTQAQLEFGIAIINTGCCRTTIQQLGIGQVTLADDLLFFMA